MNSDNKRSGGSLIPLLALLTVSLSIFCLLVWQVSQHTVFIPFWDQWQFVPLYEKYQQGLLTLADLFAQKNEHRSAVPRLLWLWMADLSGWNHYWEVALNLLVGIGIFTLAALLFARLSNQQGSQAVWLALVPVAIFSFSLVQYENWLWGWQLQLFLCSFFLLLSVFLLSQKSDWPQVLMAAATCFLATFSFASGLMTWLAIAALLMLRVDTQRASKLVCWSVFTAIAFGLYFYGYQKPRFSPSFLAPLFNPIEYLGYILGFLGAPVFRSLEEPKVWTQVAGFAGLVLWLLILLPMRKQRGELALYAPAICITLFALFCGGIIGIGRLGKGMEQALSSRYTTFSILFWVGLMLQYALVFSMQKRAWHAVVMVLVAVVAMGNSWSHRQAMESWSELRRPAAEHLKHGKMEERYLRKLCWRPGIIHERLPVLYRYRASIYQLDGVKPPLPPGQSDQK